jgi:hypothetical protein
VTFLVSFCFLWACFFFFVQLIELQGLADRIDQFVFVDLRMKALQLLYRGYEKKGF